MCGQRCIPLAITLIFVSFNLPRISLLRRGFLKFLWLFKTFINRYITLHFTWRIGNTSWVLPIRHVKCNVMYLFIKVLKSHKSFKKPLRRREATHAFSQQDHKITIYRRESPIYFTVTRFLLTELYISSCFFSLRQFSRPTQSVLVYSGKCHRSHFLIKV